VAATRRTKKSIKTSPKHRQEKALRTRKRKAKLSAKRRKSRVNAKKARSRRGKLFR
jgi:hypothetical protein